MCVCVCVNIHSPLIIWAHYLLHYLINILLLKALLTNSGLPIDWIKSLEFGVTVLILIYFSCIQCHLPASVVNILIGYFRIMMSFGWNIHRKFHDLFENYKVNRNNDEILQKLLDVIHLHSEAKELSTAYFFAIRH